MVRALERPHTTVRELDKDGALREPLDELVLRELVKGGGRLDLGPLDVAVLALSRMCSAMSAPWSMPRLFLMKSASVILRVTSRE